MRERVTSERFVGRRQELAVLDADSGAVLIAGDAGVGKSRLVAELAERARAAGRLVLIGECVELADGELPYGAIVAALRPLLREQAVRELLSAAERRELAPLWPELGRADDGARGDGGDAPAAAAPAAGDDAPDAPTAPVPPVAGQGRVFALLLTLLVALAERQPVVVVIEDLHWADRSTRDFLAFLVRAARGEPIALVATFRAEELHPDHPLRPFAAELARVRDVRRIELRGFTRAELALQVQDILGEPPPAALVQRLFERTEGNAFYTEELLAAGDGAELSAVELLAAGAGGGLPASLRDALLLRIEPLSIGARRLLAVAATAERAIDERLLASVGELPPEAFASALREALAHHVLVTHGDGGAYGFRHALVREAVYRDLLAQERAELHGALARALEQRPELAASGVGVAGELAHHWQAAGEPARALAASVRASAEAERAFAFVEAERHCERALALWGQVPDAAASAGLDHAELLARAAYAAIRGDWPQRAVARAREAIAELDPRREPLRVARLHQLAGRALWLNAEHADGLVAHREAVRLVPADPPTPERAHALAGEAQALMLKGRSDDAHARCAEALELAETVGDRVVEAHVRNTLAGLGWRFGDPVAQATQARELAVAAGSLEEIGRSYANGSEALEATGRIDDAIALAQEGVELAQRWGMGDFRFYLTCSIAGWQLRRGRLQEVERLVGEEVRQDHGTVAQLHDVNGRVALLRGDFAVADAELERAVREAHGLGGPEWYPAALAARGQLRLWEGRPDDAAALLRTALDAVGDLQLAPWLGDFCEVYPTAARIAAERAELARGGGRNASRAPGGGETAPAPAAPAPAAPAPAAPAPAAPAPAAPAPAAPAPAAEAAAALAALDAMLAVLPPPGRAPRALACRALTAAECTRADGRSDAAAWALAVERLSALGEPYPTAYAQLRQAQALLGARGAVAAAASLLRTAHATTERLGERPLRALIEAVGARAGIALGAAAPPPDPTAELGITAREREVLELLSEGRTNREIAVALVIAEKTASVHVSHILAKLGAANRGEAAAIARRLGAV